MRLNAYLARAGIASRRGADELIKAGRVTVNGEAGQLNTFVGETDDVRVDGRTVGKQKLRYVLLNKPRGTITTAKDPQGRPTVVDLVGGAIRVVPVAASFVQRDGSKAHGNSIALREPVRTARPSSPIEPSVAFDQPAPRTDERSGSPRCSEAVSARPTQYCSGCRIWRVDCGGFL